MSTGVDKVTAQDYGVNLIGNLLELEQKLRIELLSKWMKRGAALHGSKVITEEPGAGKPHAGICVGASG